MLGALPPAILFVVAGFAGFVRYISLHTAPFAARSLSLAALAVGVFALQPWAVPRKSYQGFDQPAHFLVANDEFSGGNLLVVSNALGEGAFISEVAMHEQRPGHIILRSSKFLGSSTWNGTNFELRYKTAVELREFLDHAPIDAVILDTRTGKSGQQDAIYQLQEEVTQALVSDPNWKFRGGYPKLPNQSTWINLYSRVGARPPGDIRLDMRYTLNRDIVHPGSDRGGAQAPSPH